MPGKPPPLSPVAYWDEGGRLLGLALRRDLAPEIERRLRRWLGRPDLRPAPEPWRRALEETLRGYFLGWLRVLRHPLRPLGTPFEVSVWDTLRQIPYGETRTYGWLARRLGCPGAARAVGRALGANPLPLFHPCHRVVAARGPGGFSAGLELKRLLLSLEGVSLPRTGR